MGLTSAAKSGWTFLNVIDMWTVLATERSNVSQNTGFFLLPTIPMACHGEEHRDEVSGIPAQTTKGVFMSLNPGFPDRVHYINHEKCEAAFVKGGRVIEDAAL